MIAKNKDNSIERKDPSPSSYFVKSIRLPFIDSNCIFTSRSVNKSLMPKDNNLSHQGLSGAL